MSKDRYDVVVVGCGPGGSSAGRYAAKAGLSVCILDRSQEVGHPVRCGEGIAKVWLDEIGLSPDRKWISRDVEGAKIISPDGTTITLDEAHAGNECGYVVHRDVFDQTLAKMAANESAEIKLKTFVKGLITKNGRIKGVKASSFGKDQDIYSDIIIAADGFESQVGPWAGIDTKLKPRDINTCFQYTLSGVDIDPDHNSFYIGNEVAPGGYAWVFPKSERSANVGIGVNLSRIKKRGSVKQYLDDFIKRDPGLNPGKPIRQTAGAISCCSPLEKTTTDGVMLVGDAARHIDPLTGGGVVFACLGGKRAGEVAAKAMEVGDTSNEVLKEYDKLWRTDFEEQLIRNYFGKEKFLELSDATMNKLIDALSGVELNNVTTLDILQAVNDKYPELVEEFGNLIM
jgi:digeranylgeranylglycerophospholipid reductase